MCSSKVNAAHLPEDSRRPPHKHTSSNMLWVKSISSNNQNSPSSCVTIWHTPLSALACCECARSVGRLWACCWWRVHPPRHHRRAYASCHLCHLLMTWTRRRCGLSAASCPRLLRPFCWFFCFRVLAACEALKARVGRQALIMEKCYKQN